MWIVLLIFVVTVGVCATFVWPRPGDATPAAGRGSAPAHAVAPESLEGVLVAQLAADEITRHQYMRAMEQLAARDDERHPLSVPPEVGGAA